LLLENEKLTALNIHYVAESGHADVCLVLIENDELIILQRTVVTLDVCLLLLKKNKLSL